MRRWLVIPSIGVHVLIIMIALVLGAWHLDRLEPAKLHVEIGMAPPPPPAESGSPALPKPAFTQKQQKKIARDLVVPPEVKPPDAAPTSVATTAATGEGPGNGLGSGTGSGEGDGNGSGSSPCTSDCGPPPAPVKPPAQTVVPPTALSQLFLTGERNIEPPAPTKQVMLADGKTKVVASFKLCLDASGSVASTRIIKSSGYAAYDDALASGMAGWRYKPYSVDGRGMPVCSVVTFVYDLHTIH